MINDALSNAIEALMRDVTERAILPHYQTLAADQIEAKAADDVVTVADNLSEQLLTEGLAKILDLPVLGEEAAFADEKVFELASGDCWIVDPLDGTRNFARGEPPFGILLALSRGGEAERGWIYDCLTQRLCVTERGKGAFVNGEKITAQPTGRDKPVAAVSLLFVDPDKRASLKAALGDHYDQVDIPWCCAEQYPRLALGENDLALFERTLPWDHAAAALWLNEAGGKAARPDGSAYRVDEWQRPGLIGAANPKLWDEMAERIAAIS